MSLADDVVAVAIEDSSREDRIIHVPWTSQIECALLALADDYADLAHGVEAWGDVMDEDGTVTATWRVHLDRWATDG